MVAEEAADLDLPRRRCRSTGRRPPRASRSSSRSAATARSCARPSWPGRRRRRCSASTSARSASWPRPRSTTSTRRCATSSTGDVHGGRAAHPGRARPSTTARLIAESWALNEVSVEKGAAGADARAAGRRGRPAAVAVRLRRRGLRHPDRLDGVRVLGRRPGGVARGGGAAAGADQRARAVQPAAGDRADLDVRRSPWTRTRRSRCSAATGGGPSTCRPARRSRCGAASCRCGWPGCAPRPFTDRLVAKFALPVDGLAAAIDA